MNHFQAVGLLAGMILCLTAVSYVYGKDDSSMPAQEEFRNHLKKEKSPYLLQHADNPVDWYPWGPQAFEKAAREDKPIFLSIGYSSCHWCHVMEEESFENEEVARILNQYFVSVKVDREERPDIDQVYMKVVVAMRGQGGWPLTVFLTPERKPFFGGAYFPPHPKGGSPGLIDILHAVSEAWKNDRSNLVESGESAARLFQEKTPPEGARETLTQDALTAAYDQFSQMYDPALGGFGTSPKFPSGHNLSFLLRYGKRFGGTQALAMAERTLRMMAQGGVYDHLGGGFHRYATDRAWRIPHFEKMLYDQAILARTYVEAYQIMRQETYARTAREIFDYVLRDMRGPEGGFYGAEDADSPDPDEYAPARTGAEPQRMRGKKEGAFYLWRDEEVNDILDGEEADIFRYYFGIEPRGNLSFDGAGEIPGKNILYIAHDIEDTARHFSKDSASTAQILERSKKKVLEARRQRPRPGLDDKILTDWNGLMIASLAFGSKVLKEPRYEEAARQAADFILQRLRDDKGRLLHRYRDGESAVLGTLDDYAFFIHGLLDLYEATFEIRYLEYARQLAGAMIDLFWDKTGGGFYFTANDAEALLFRHKEAYDGAIPSGNSMAALDLVRLAHMTGQNFWEEKQERIFQGFADEVKKGGAAHAQFLSALDFALGPAQEIVISGAKEDPKVRAMIDATYGYFIPRRVLILRPDKEEEIISVAPFVKDLVPLAGKATAYVCENRVCKLPVQEVEQLQRILEGLR